MTVQALTAADPADRPVSVEAARELLATARRDAHPRGRDGDPILVLRQLPDLPGADTLSPTRSLTVPATTLAGSTLSSSTERVGPPERSTPPTLEPGRAHRLRWPLSLAFFVVAGLGVTIWVLTARNGPGSAPSPGTSSSVSTNSSAADSPRLRLRPAGRPPPGRRRAIRKHRRRSGRPGRSARANRAHGSRRATGSSRRPGP